MEKLPKKSDGWGAIAAYIIAKENDGSWGELSFTRWGDEQAKAIGISKYSFWEYRRAGMLYNQILEEMSLKEQPPLKELTTVSAEHLNVLQKLWRVTGTTDLFRELCERVVVKKNISRRELDDLWASLRPAMAEQTARGREKKKSFSLQVSMDDKLAQDRILDGLLVVALRDNMQSLQKHFGFYGPPQIFDCRNFYRPYPSEVVDVLVVGYRDNKEFNCAVHGISIRREFAENPAIYFSDKYPCDNLWIILTHDHKGSGAEFDNYPSYLGIIDAAVDANKSKVTSMAVIRKPEPVVRLEQETINLLAGSCRRPHN